MTHTDSSDSIRDIPLRPSTCLYSCTNRHSRLWYPQSVCSHNSCNSDDSPPMGNSPNHPSYGGSDGNASHLLRLLPLLPLLHTFSFSHHSHQTLYLLCLLCPLPLSIAKMTAGQAASPALLTMRTTTLLRTHFHRRPKIVRLLLRRRSLETHRQRVSCFVALGYSLLPSFLLHCFLLLSLTVPVAAVVFVVEILVFHFHCCVAVLALVVAVLAVVLVVVHVAVFSAALLHVAQVASLLLTLKADVPNERTTTGDYSCIACNGMWMCIQDNHPSKTR